MKNISSALEGKTTSRDNKITEEIIADDTVQMKFASTTSVDVERYLPTMRQQVTTLADNRQSFLFENSKQHMIVICYNEKKIRF